MLLFVFTENSLVSDFQNDITLAEALALKQNFFRSDPRDKFCALSRWARRALLFGRNIVQQISNLAFGGRGIGLLHKFKNCKVAHVDFDQTKGFPGEGWSNQHSNFRIATWNTRSVSVERFGYCKSLKCDVLAVTELWRTQEKFQSNNKAFVVGEAKIDKETEQARFPKDRAAGVGIFYLQ